MGNSNKKQQNVFPCGFGIKQWNLGSRCEQTLGQVKKRMYICKTTRNSIKKN